MFKKLHDWYFGLDPNQRTRLWKAAGLIVIAIAMAILLSGCAYQQLYAGYLKACAMPENQKSITVPVNGGSLKIGQGCSIAPPENTDATLVNAGANIAGGIINGGVQLVNGANARKLGEQQSKSNEVIFTKAFDAAGAKIDGAGGDVVVGSGNGISKSVTNPQPVAPTSTTPAAPSP